MKDAARKVSPENIAVGVDAEGQLESGMTAHARLAFENLVNLLAVACTKMTDVVELAGFHTDLRGDIANFVAVKATFIPEDLPAQSDVGDTLLVYSKLLAEMRAVAVVGSASR